MQRKFLETQLKYVKKKKKKRLVTMLELRENIYIYIYVYVYILSASCKVLAAIQLFFDKLKGTIEILSTLDRLK